MIPYAQTLISDYLEHLSAKEPVPGGGSAAALSGAMGAALIEMVTRYSIGKGKPEAIETSFAQTLDKAGKLRKRLLDLITLDSQAYLNMREAKKIGEDAYKKATVLAAEVPGEVKKLCLEGLSLTAFLHQEGNRYLLSDVIAAEAFLKAGADAASAMIEANQ